MLRPAVNLLHMNCTRVECRLVMFVVMWKWSPCSCILGPSLCLSHDHSFVARLCVLCVIQASARWRESMICWACRRSRLDWLFVARGFVLL